MLSLYEQPHSVAVAATQDRVIPFCLASLLLLQAADLKAVHNQQEMKYGTEYQHSFYLQSCVCGQITVELIFKTITLLLM